MEELIDVQTLQDNRFPRPSSCTTGRFLVGVVSLVVMVMMMMLFMMSWRT